MRFLEKKGNQTAFQKSDRKWSPIESCFWNLVKPILSNKGGLASNDISLVKNNEIVTDDQKLTEIFNDHYINIVEKSSGTKHCNIADTVAIDDDRQIVRLILQKYKNHPRISAIIQAPENNLD